MAFWSTKEELNHLFNESMDVIVISTFFDPKDRLHQIQPSNYQLKKITIQLIKKATKVLKYGGLLFVYGLPHHLAFWGEYISLLDDETSQMVFKYWIGLNFDNIARGETLKPNHLGLLMFVKTNGKNNSVSSFHLNLNTDLVRVAHVYCSACGQNVKDWGGKKHLMNPNGIALSDIWKDLLVNKLKDNIVPDAVLERIETLTKTNNVNYLHIIQTQPDIESINNSDIRGFTIKTASKKSISNWKSLESIEIDKVYFGDCISFLENIASLYPEGIFDLAFADPPYNLKKSYDRYKDSLAEKQYIEWCNEWLARMAKTLKPGGTLIVLNLPKWAIHHAAFLNNILEFRHWIIWDALSEPRGKIMPAHYALLYYTKPGKKPTFNYSSSKDNNKSLLEYVVAPDSPEYCLRPSCVKKRKFLGNNNKVELSDIWFDIHRIKHKRDRDTHPCQLPEKLMERIISLTTNKEDLIFDPFCGTGTTAFSAYKLDRHYITIDIDPNYVQVANEKLATLQKHLDLFGNPIIPKQSTKRSKPLASKKEIELYLQKLAQRLGREPLESDILSDSADMLKKIDMVYPSRLAAIKRCRVVLKGNNLR